MNIEELVIKELNEIPKHNSESLRIYTLNTCILKRLNKVGSQVDHEESVLFDSLKKEGSTNNINRLTRSLRRSNKYLSQSDFIISKLFNDLQS